MSEKIVHYKNLLPNLGVQVRLWRVAKGMTQSGLEQKAALSHNAISRIECGSVSPRWDTIERISRALDISVEQLQFQQPAAQVSETQSKYRDDDDFTALRTAFKKVPETKRKELLRTFLELIRITVGEHDE